MRTKLPTCPMRYPSPLTKLRPVAVSSPSSTVIVAPVTSCTVPINVGSRCIIVPLGIEPMRQFLSKELAEGFEVTKKELAPLGGRVGSICNSARLHGQAIEDVFGLLDGMPISLDGSQHSTIGGQHAEVWVHAGLLDG